MAGRRHAVQGPLEPYAAGFREELVLLGYSERGPWSTWGCWGI